MHFIRFKILLIHPYQAIKYAIDPLDPDTSRWEVDILSMSWGFPDLDPSSPHATLMASAIHHASEMKKIMFAAASNYGANLPPNDPIPFPAKMPGVICINSSDGYGNKSDYNPPPRKTDYNFCTLGEAVLPTWDPKASHQTGKRETGTSFSAPIGASIAASFIEFIRQKISGEIEIPDELKCQARTREGILKIFVASSCRTKEGFQYLQPWSLLQCEHSENCPCRPNRERAARKVCNILRDDLIRPEDMNKIARFFAQASEPSVVEADVRDMENLHKPKCLDRTRVKLRLEIDTWANNPHGKHIYWLEGQLGTGKSTVARTIALEFSQQGRLGGNFFFSKDREALSNDSKFFRTIAHQLSELSPMLRLHYVNARENDLAYDSNLERLDMRIRWEKLIREPLSFLKFRPETILIVIDALDECNGLDVRTLLELIVDAKKLQNIKLKILITSRPEEDIRKDFLDLSEEVDHFELNEDDKSTIADDISLFFRNELRSLHKRRSQLDPPDWPSEDTVRQLTERADRLFVYATMACRYIEGSDGDTATTTEQRLSQVLHNKAFATLDDMYSFILTQSIDPIIGPKGNILSRIFRQILQLVVTSAEGDILGGQFRQILGLLVTLAEPVSKRVLGEMCRFCQKRLEPKIVYARVHSLRSVLAVPDSENAPVRTLHQSFRDFLLRCPDSRLKVDESAAHRDLFNSCIQIMSRDPKARLKRNICSIDHSGIEIGQIHGGKIEECLQTHTQYACRYWVHHLKNLDSSQQKSELRDDGTVHIFLQEHFLYWLEALSWTRKLFEGIRAIQLLEDIVDVSCASRHLTFETDYIIKGNESPNLQGFIHDAKRFLLYNQSMIETAPLQTYYSALIFAPEESLVRKAFQNQMPPWICRLSDVKKEWSSLLQPFEGHKGPVISTMFSADGSTLASASHDMTVRVWNVDTGKVVRTIKDRTNWSHSMAFSPDGGKLASYVFDSAGVKIWDLKTGREEKFFKNCASYGNGIAFSRDGRLVSGSGGTYRVRDIATEEVGPTFEHNLSHFNNVAFSPDCTMLAAGSAGSLKVWNMNTRDPKWFPGSSIFAFSPDSRRLASNDGGKVSVWNVATGIVEHTIGCSSVQSIVFSPYDGKNVAISSGSSVQVWDISAGQPEAPQFQFQGHPKRVNTIAFSPDGSRLASGSDDYTLLLWNVGTAQAPPTPAGHSGSINTIVFSSDGSKLATGSGDKTVRVWDVRTGLVELVLREHRGPVQTVVFSNDGRRLASASYDEVNLWNVESGSPGASKVEKMPTCSEHVLSIALSSNGSMLATGSLDKTVEIWNVSTGKRHSLRKHSKMVNCVVFSLDASMLASACSGKIIVWNTTTWRPVRILQRGADSIAFSSDGSRLAFGSRRYTKLNTVSVQVCNVATGEIDLEGLWDVGQCGQAFPTVEVVLFSPDDSMLAATSSDKVIRLWNIPERKIEQTLEGHWASLNSAVFSVDGSKSDFFYSVDSSGAWITQKGSRLLSLPSEYRPGKIAAKGNTLAIGTSSGRVVIFVFPSNKRRVRWFPEVFLFLFPFLLLLLVLALIFILPGYSTTFGHSRYS
jgi:WD40 repeat protein